ncbi:MAG: Txe/YoeB family addiction module toxin [Lactobacillales bacterium]|nr:Txe/YoeB family addiction module toxin [Lactobacillales bacterium]
MKKLWEDSAWSEYENLQTKDKTYLKKLNAKIKQIERNGYDGAEPLKHDLSGLYSISVMKKDRLVFRIENEVLEIYSIRGHYSDR